MTATACSRLPAVAVAMRSAGSEVPATATSSVSVRERDSTGALGPPVLTTWAAWVCAQVSFPKIRSGWIRAVRQNQRIIGHDACDPAGAWDDRRQSVQVAAPA